MVLREAFHNPYRPGAGHPPPYLAGRKAETQEFVRLLPQETILENMVLTGLRGVGKTVLLEVFKPIAIGSNWLWVGTDLSETTSLSEENIATRLIADLAVVTSVMTVGVKNQPGVGFGSSATAVPLKLDFPALAGIYRDTPGLISDKLKRVLEVVWECLPKDKHRGIVFAYDEAQNLADHAEARQFPLSMLLDVFQSIQRKGVRFMLLLTGLPTLFPKLVEARTYAERMFRVVVLARLSDPESRDAVVKPIQDAKCPIQFSEVSITTIIQHSAGYPYFIQYLCRESFDVFLQKLAEGQPNPSVPMPDILRKLDSNFFAGRWARATDRQRELLQVVASLPNCDSEFTVQEVVERAKELLEKPFSSSHVNQMLATLSDAGLIYKNRHGKYSFAVPLFGQFILRQETQP
jgi:hypothetical protein